MKHAFSVSIGTLALVLTAQGSLLGKLLGNLNIQINACPELSINTSGKSAQGGKPQTQSSNPACPNYVPPGSAHIDEASVSSEDSESQEDFDIASQNIDALQLSSSSSSSSSLPSLPLSALLAAALPMAPAVPSNIAAEPAFSPTSSPAYQLSPLLDILPTPTNKDLLAENEIIEPLLISSVVDQPAKCVYKAQTPEITDVIVQGLPTASGIPATPLAMPAIPGWADPYWYQPVAPTQPPAAEWTWIAEPAAPAAPTVAGDLFTKATATRVTINIPDGADGVFFGTRNVGAYQFSN